MDPRTRFGRLVAMKIVVLAASASEAAAPSCSGGWNGCEPRCRGTWHEQKTHEPSYELRCEYACDRARDPWLAPDPDCRCHPPCGRIYVKKRLYKSAGAETVDRVPRYEVQMVPAVSCRCGGCRTAAASPWDPLGLARLLCPWIDKR